MGVEDGYHENDAVIISAVMSALAMLLVVPSGAEAGGHGVRMHSFQFAGHPPFGSVRHHRAFGHRRGFGLSPWPLYGYDYVPPYTSDGDYSTPQIVVRQPEPPQAPACQHSEQVYTVPSESGGTRQIKIMRC